MTTSRGTVLLIAAVLLGGCGGGDGTSKHTIGGSLSGLASGQSVVLQNNGGDDLTLSTDGAFTFATAVDEGSAYAVTVKTQPVGQTCAASNNSGIASTNIIDVSVVCSTNTYTIGGSLSGLAGTVVLQNNGGDDLTLSADGAFTFATAVNEGSTYAVMVKTQPVGQTCTASNNSGTASTNVTDVSVVCSTNTYAIGGSLSGLAGTVVLQNNGGDDLSLTADGEFTFTTAVAHGAHYEVTVKSQPAGQQCSVVGGSGTAMAEVSGVDVQCFDNHALNANPLSKSVELSWEDTGANSYDLYYANDPGCNVVYFTGCTGDNLVNGVTSPYTVTGLTNGQHYTFWLQSNHLSGHATLAESGARPDRLATDGEVNALATGADGTVYQGGTFTRVGAASGSGMPLRTDSLGTQPFPVVVGSVEAVVPDGAGGWYIGGWFTHVGGIERNNVAHIRVDGSVGTWNPNANSGVEALAVDGGVVYAGGDFTLIGGQTRNRIAALEAVTGNATDWNPNSNGGVYALAVDSGIVYAGGGFTTIGIASRNRLAALDMSTGDATGWNPNSNGGVYALTVSGGTVYAGGGFTTMGIETRNHIAAIDAATGAVTDWNPNANSWVEALAVDGGTVYTGGNFTEIGIQTRNHIAALDAVTGDPTDWDPNADSDVYVLTIEGTTVYAGGKFAAIGTQTRNYIAALDAATGNATDWNPSPKADPEVGGAVYALAVNGSTLYAGGVFTLIGGQTRNRIAALDASGVLTDWNPNASGRVYALAVDGATVYAGGDFTNIGGQTRNRIAALDASSGIATAWDPNANSGVYALAVDSGIVYAGGSFTSIDAQTRNYIAALDAAGGNATLWNPAANNVVHALAVGDGTVYAGGRFTDVGAATRNYIAALDTSSGTATTWDPNAGGGSYPYVYALAVNGGTIYAGGNFTSIDGQSLNRIAALDAATGKATTWNPNASGVVRALAVEGTTIYVGGGFSSIGGQVRNRIAALDTASGIATGWDPNANGFVYALAVDAATVNAGGDFTTIGDEPAGGFAVFEK